MRRRLRDQGRGWDVLVVAEPRRTLSSTQSQVILFQFARWHVPLSVPELGAPSAVRDADLVANADLVAKSSFGVYLEVTPWPISDDSPPQAPQRPPASTS